MSQKTKEEILFSEIDKDIPPYPDGRQRVSNFLNKKSDWEFVYAAMSEYASQEAIAFAEWLERRYFRSSYKKLDGEVIWRRKAGDHVTTDEIYAEYTASELYHLFKSQTP